MPTKSRDGAGAPRTRREKVLARQRAEQRRRQAIVAGTVVAVLAVVAIIAVVVGKTQSSPSRSSAAPSTAVGSALPVGPTSAPVTVDIYEDFQCPACEKFETTVGPTIEQLQAAGTARVLYHQFAFLGPESVRASNAAACASEAGKFLPFHDVLYANQPAEHSGGYQNKTLIEAGAKVGLTSADFKACVNDGRFTGWVRTATDDVSKSGVNQTPTVKIDGKVVEAETVFDPAKFKAAVEAAAKQKQ